MQDLNRKVSVFIQLIVRTEVYLDIVDLTYMSVNSKARRLQL